MGGGQSREGGGVRSGQNQLLTPVSGDSSWGQLLVLLQTFLRLQTGYFLVKSWQGRRECQDH